MGYIRTYNNREQAINDVNSWNAVEFTKCKESILTSVNYFVKEISLNLATFYSSNLQKNKNEETDLNNATFELLLKTKINENGYITKDYVTTLFIEEIRNQGIENVNVTIIDNAEFEFINYKHINKNYHFTRPVYQVKEIKKTEKRVVNTGKYSGSISQSTNLDNLDINLKPETRTETYQYFVYDAYEEKAEIKVDIDINYFILNDATQSEFRAQEEKLRKLPSYNIYDKMVSYEKLGEDGYKERIIKDTRTAKSFSKEDYTYLIISSILCLALAVLNSIFLNLWSTPLPLSNPFVIITLALGGVNIIYFIVRWRLQDDLDVLMWLTLLPSAYSLIRLIGLPYNVPTEVVFTESDFNVGALFSVIFGYISLIINWILLVANMVGGVTALGSSVFKTFELISDIKCLEKDKADGINQMKDIEQAIKNGSLTTIIKEGEKLRAMTYKL